MSNQSPQEFLVSVIIPSYNRATTVIDTIFSAINQTLPALEIIIVDDGSSDNTRQLVQSTFGDKVNYIYQENAGVSAARNKGIGIAKGNWIAFLDSDDIWKNDKLLYDYNLTINSSKVEFIHGNRQHQQSDGTLNEGRDHSITTDFSDKKFLLSTWTIKTSTVVIKKSLLRRLEQAFNPQLKTCEDYDFFWRAVISSKKIAYAEQENVVIKMTADGISRNQTEKNRILDNMEAMQNAKKWASRESNAHLANIIQERILKEFIRYLYTIKNTEGALSMLKELGNKKCYLDQPGKFIYFIQRKLIHYFKNKKK